MTDGANLARGFLFLIFLFLGLSIRAARGGAASRLIAFVVVVSITVGVTQREAWPFTNWALFHHIAPANFGGIAIELIDERGVAHPADHRMWQPAGQEEAEAWMNLHVPSLADHERRELGRDLLARAEQTRQRIAEGERASNDRLLGRWSAPYHFQRRAIWTPDVRPFRAIRFVWIHWSPEERFRHPEAVEKRVLFEYAGR